jgi:hypothetical protein
VNNSKPPSGGVLKWRLYNNREGGCLTPLRDRRENREIRGVSGHPSRKNGMKTEVG